MAKLAVFIPPTFTRNLKPVKLFFCFELRASIFQTVKNFQKWVIEQSILAWRKHHTSAKAPSFFSKARHIVKIENITLVKSYGNPYKGSNNGAYSWIKSIRNYYRQAQI